MYPERFRAWQLIRLRGRGPYSGSAWRAAAHIYRDRAINCMEAMRSYQESIHVWEEAYAQLESQFEALCLVADDGAWHSSEDCDAEGRANTCDLCRAIRARKDVS